MEPEYAMPGRPYACGVVWPMVYLAFGAILFAAVPAVRAFAAPFCLSVLPCGVCMLVCSALWAGTGRSAVSRPFVLIGSAAILSGAGADIFATLYHSPRLEREANPTLRAFLDRGYDLETVYAYGGSVQLLLVGTSLALWYGLARHRNELLATMPASGSLLAYLKAGTGAREKSYRAWCCPLTWDEMPWAYHYCAWTAVFLAVTGVYRHYLAAEWFGIAAVDPLWVRFVAPTALFIILCVTYSLWLSRARRQPAFSTPDPLPTEP